MSSTNYLSILADPAAPHFQEYSDWIAYILSLIKEIKGTTNFYNKVVMNMGDIVGDVNNALSLSELHNLIQELKNINTDTSDNIETINNLLDILDQRITEYEEITNQNTVDITELKQKLSEENLAKYVLQNMNLGELLPVRYIRISTTGRRTLGGSDSLVTGTLASIKALNHDGTNLLNGKVPSSDSGLTTSATNCPFKGKLTYDIGQVRRDLEYIHFYLGTGNYQYHDVEVEVSSNNSTWYKIFSTKMINLPLPVCTKGVRLLMSNVDNINEVKIADSIDKIGKLKSWLNGNALDSSMGADMRSNYIGATRIFIQSGDPGSAAKTNDIWIKI